MPQIVFDEDKWTQIIRRPDWYLEFIPYAKDVQDQLGKKSQKAREFRNQVRYFFEKQLLAGNLALAKNGPDFDEQRLPIDTIVIHHTSHKGRYDLDFMEATQLLNIYAPHFADAAATQHMNPKPDHDITGEAIWSGHFRNGRQTFLCYHWLMRMDGTFEKLLEDEQIGWHAGNWEINQRSVAICLDNDYEKQDPSDETLQKLAAFIRQNYPGKKIIGHREARTGTVCPGGNFLDGWKGKLLEYLANGP